VVHISSDDDEFSTTSQASSFSAREPRGHITSQNKHLPCKTSREKPAVGSSRKTPKIRPAHCSKPTQSATERGQGEGEGEGEQHKQQVINSFKPTTGHHTEERIDIGSKRRQTVPKTNNAVGQSQKELGKVKTKAVQRADKPRSTNGTPVNTKPTKTAGSSVPLRTQPRKPPLDRDSSPEIPLAILRKQQNDRSAILKDPKKVARDPQLLALQQKKKHGLFGRDILRNNRSESWALGLGSVFLAPAQHVPLVNVQSSSDKDVKSLLVKMKCRPERLKAIAQNAISKSRQRAVMADRARRAEAGGTVIRGSSNHAYPERLKNRERATQDPTRLSSRTSISATPDQTTAIAKTGAASSFNVPPKSARQFTSSRDALADIRERRERASSVTSRFSTFSPTASVSTIRKRKNVESLSDDSDFAPTEPSPEVKTKTAAPKPGVAIKKTKMKNDYDFKVPQTPPAKADSRSMPATPSAPIAKKQKLTPKTPETPMRAVSTLPSRESNMFPPTGSRLGGRTQVSSSVRPMRGAVAQANQKLQDLAKKDKDFYTKEAKRKAEKEEGNYITPKILSKEQMETIGKRFRSMSVTPTPSRVQKSEDEDEEEDGRVHGMEDWMNERLSGDRYVAKVKELQMAEYDSLGEEAVSQHKWVNGVIVQVGGGDQEMEDV
jgi:hypothetical protein